MTTEQLLANYAAIRARLRNPPQAVYDSGAGEHPKKVTIQPQLKQPILVEPSGEIVVVPVTPPEPPPAPLLPIRHVRWPSVLSFVARHFGFRVQDLTGRSRTMQISLARHIAFYLIHNLCCCSKNYIGHLLGYDHTTVIYGIRRAERLMAQHPDLADQVALLEELILADHRRRFTLPPDAQPYVEVHSGEGLSEPSLSAMEAGS